MKLEKRDIAECLGLSYIGTELNWGGNLAHKFLFGYKELYYNHLTEDQAWDKATEDVLDTLHNYVVANL